MEYCRTGDVCIHFGAFTASYVVFLPLILLRPSAIIINIPISTHSPHLLIQQLLQYTHTDMKEQPLLHTYRKRVSCCPLCLILGCISAPVPHNLPLIPAQTQPMTRSVIVRKTKTEMNSPGNAFEAYEDLWTSFRRVSEKWIWALLCKMDLWIIISISYFDF